MLAKKPSQVEQAGARRPQVAALSYEPSCRAASQRCMVIANTFILWVLGAAAFLGVAAVVHKRSRRDRDVVERSSNHAS